MSIKFLSSGYTTFESFTSVMSETDAGDPKFLSTAFIVTVLVVGFIATAQAFIAVSLLLKGRIYKAGIIGGVIFLIAIAPLGVGSAFPCTLLLALALGMIYKNHNEFILTRKIHEVQVTAD